jgi:hypothetical protein
MEKPARPGMTPSIGDSNYRGFIQSLAYALELAKHNPNDPDSQRLKAALVELMK